MSVECSDCGNKVHDPSCSKYKGPFKGMCLHCQRAGTVGISGLCSACRGVIMKTDFDEVKDSGDRRTFETGSVRDVRKGKGRYDLISPIALKRLAKHYENGAAKYGDRNWEKGQPLSSYMDSLIRHAYAYMAGDRSEDHAAAIAWNAFAVMHTEAMIKQSKLPASFNDLPEGLTDVG